MGASLLNLGVKKERTDFLEDAGVVAVVEVFCFLLVADWSVGLASRARFPRRNAGTFLGAVEVVVVAGVVEVVEDVVDVVVVVVVGAVVVVVVDGFFFIAAASLPL